MYSVGDKVVHPLHGAGVIERLETKKVDGIARVYYVMRMPAGEMIVLIPQDTAETIGVRPVISPDEAEQLLARFSDIRVEMTQNWNQRYRENMVRIKSGDLMEVAAVIKCLIERDNERGLSTGERRMLRSAKQILISELVMSKNKPYDEIESMVDAALA